MKTKSSLETVRRKLALAGIEPQATASILHGRASQQVRPGLIIKGILRKQVPLADGNYVAEASVSDIYTVYAKAAKSEKLSRHKGKRMYRNVMSYSSFRTFFKFAHYLGFVEPTCDGMFRITEVGCSAWQEWEDLRRAWQLLVRRKGADAVPPRSDAAAYVHSDVAVFDHLDVADLTHDGVVWLCQEYAIRYGLAPVSYVEVSPLASLGHPDLLLEDELGTKLYAVEVKSRRAKGQEVLRGIGQCANYRCSIPNVSPCLVIPAGLSEQVCSICNKLSFSWMSVVAFSDTGEFSLVYGKDSFIEDPYSL